MQSCGSSSRFTIAHTEPHVLVWVPGEDAIVPILRPFDHMFANELLQVATALGESSSAFIAASPFSVSFPSAWWCLWLSNVVLAERPATLEQPGDGLDPLERDGQLVP